MTGRLIRAFDSSCSAPLPKGQLPTGEDLTVDYRSGPILIANIGLSEDLGFLERGDDLVISEAADGTLKKVHSRECLHATAWEQSNLVWLYTLVDAGQAQQNLPSTYREKWRLNQDWNSIV
ncbi:uncharacterized protein Z520_06756 [Fonsecaea multimorphosa CBS 102226]|uniref:Uncharacterized protein n=1 Tax=Fonsecaea multimorphosa CBS 102226 TaxID=1442371 RepID=A0A0D2K2K1_9EURO|nr:uncharacterized protein Z520_06756 [Fonsecaea multimorphosa CBS 102226]KIX97304.1 hypothetical protein Z520_06756 [Fonsecaea multimorphosa CBS 102226]